MLQFACREAKPCLLKRDVARKIRFLKGVTHPQFGGPQKPESNCLSGHTGQGLGEFLPPHF